MQTLIAESNKIYPEAVNKNDIYDAIAQIRTSFLAANFRPPSVVLLESHDEGMLFLSAIRQKNQWSCVIGSPDLGHQIKMADGSIWMELKIMDIAVRWPANKTATRDGSWSYT